MIIDPPYKRRTVTELSREELTGWVQGVRERLMSGRRRYEESLHAKEEIEQAKLLKQYEQHMKMFAKEDAAVEKALVKLEARLTKMLAIPLKEKDDVDNTGHKGAGSSRAGREAYQQLLDHARRAAGGSGETPAHDGPLNGRGAADHEGGAGSSGSDRPDAGRSGGSPEPRDHQEAQPVQARPQRSGWLRIDPGSGKPATRAQQG